MNRRFANGKGHYVVQEKVPNPKPFWKWRDVETFVWLKEAQEYADKTYQMRYKDEVVS